MYTTTIRFLIILVLFVGCNSDQKKLTKFEDPPRWEASFIADNGNGNGWAIADFDNDGDPDLTWAKLNGELYWYENTSPGFQSHLIDNITNMKFSGQFAFDLDQDGDQDLIHLKFTTPSQLSWYENSGNGVAFTEHVVSDTIGQLTNMFSTVVDIDGDGDLDIGAADNGNGKYIWFENLGNGLNWTQNTLKTYNSSDVASITWRDIDGDSDPDLIACINNQIIYYKNQLPDLAWPETLIGASEESWTIKSADIDDDNDNDIVSMDYQNGNVKIFKNQQNGSVWTSSIAIQKIEFPFIGSIDDIDNDGNLDIVYSENKSISWLKNTGNGDSWEKSIIVTSSSTDPVFYGVFGLADEHGLGDFDQDSNLDIVAVTVDPGGGKEVLQLYTNPN